MHFANLSIRQPMARAAAALAMLLAAGLSVTSFAQEPYPSRPVTLVVGFSAGGQSDILGRKLAARLGPMIGGTVVVLNKEGATSTIGARYVAESKPDGYTLLLGGCSGMVMAPLVMKVTYDPLKSFRSIAMLTRQSQAIAVHPSVPANNLQELISLIKANPGKYSYATGGIGGSDHLTAELFSQIAGDLKMLHVPFKGGAPAMSAVVGGQIPVVITALSGIYPNWKAGQIRLLAVTSPKRASMAPDTPTAEEAGLPMVAEACNFLTAPAQTPAPVIELLRSATSRLMADPGFIAELVAMGSEPVPQSTPESTDRYIQSEIEKWRKVVAKANITSN